MNTGRLLAALAFLGLAGCAGSIDFRRDADGNFEILGTGGRPVPRTAVLPIRYDRAADQARIDQQYPGERYALGTDLSHLQDDVVADLNAYCRAEGADPHIPIRTPWPAGGGGDRPPDALFDEALHADADLLLAIDIDDLDVSWRKPNGWYYLNIFVWFYFWVPSWFIADEEYGIDVHGTVRAYDVRSAAPLFEHVLSVETTVAVDDFDRGWSVFGILTAPGSLGPTDWEQLASYRSEEDGLTLQDEGLLELRSTIAAAVSDSLAPALADPDVASRRATIHAVVAGVSSYQDQGRLARIPAAEDAQAVAGALADLGVNPWNVALQVDGAASAANFLAAVRATGARTRADDVLVVYFSGYGTAGVASGGGRDGYLLFYDADLRLAPNLDATPSRPTGAISLAALRRAVTDPAIHARRILIIIDAGFRGAPGYGRTVGAEETASQESLPATVFRGVAGPDREVLLLAAARPEDAVIDLAGADHGLFTYVLLSAVRAGSAASPADLDRNGKLDLVQELARYLADEVSVQAEADGYRQRPVREGDPNPDTPYWLAVSEEGAGGARR